MISIINTCIFLSSFIQPHNSPSTIKPTRSAPDLQDKKFKIQSQPFDLNGLHLQFQYVVEKDIYSENPEAMVLVLDKKLVDLKRKVVLLNLTAPDDDTNPSVSLAGISNAGYSPEDFEDVNFDGYKDIMESCEICAGATRSYDDVYLFNPRTKNFIPWTDIMGWDVEVNKQNRTTTSYSKKDDGQFDYQEFKFGDHGTVLYEKNISCTLFNRKKRIYKVIYDKYIGKKRITHKTQITTIQEDTYPSVIIEKYSK